MKRERKKAGSRFGRRVRLVNIKAIDWQAAHVSPASMVLLISFLVGILSGLSAVFLKWFIGLLGHYFKSGLNPCGPNLHLLCYPLAGILLVSILQRYVLRRDYSRSTYQLSVAISSGRYRMSLSSIWQSVLTCGLTIGFGCSAGSEGPVAYSGAAIGSNVGRWLGLSDQWLRILMGIGAGAGIAGIFKSPAGGVLFTLEVLQLPMQTIPVIGLFIACILSGTTAKAFSDFSFDMMFSSVKGFDPATLGWIALFAVFCGLYSILYNRLKNCAGRFLLSVDNAWHRNIIAGTSLSMTLFLFPCFFGEGMEVLQSAINGQGIDLFSYGPFAGSDIGVGAVLLGCAAVMLLKGPLVSAAYYGGGVAGDFMPTLFAGCFAGYFFSMGCSVLFGVDLPAWYFCLVGMGAVMAGTLHAPLMALFISAEITDSFQFMPAYLLAVTLSYITVKLLTPRAWNVETGHDDVLSLRELASTPALWRAARRHRLGLRGTGLDESIRKDGINGADKSRPDRNVR